jgi:YgiT-type zinc finger domain-containing protein
MAAKECPLCGGSMQLKESVVTTYVPGNPKPTTRKVREWVCPDCDNFEEAGDDEE